MISQTISYWLPKWKPEYIKKSIHEKINYKSSLYFSENRVKELYHHYVACMVIGLKQSIYDRGKILDITAHEKPTDYRSNKNNPLYPKHF